MFKIEKNVQPPANLGVPGRKRVYPFDEMEVGDSFFMPCDDDKEIERHRKRITAAVAFARKRRLMGDKEFSCQRRTTEQDSECGLRCWRVK